MRRRNTMVLIALLAGGAGACRDESPDPSGPSPAADVQAVTAPIYIIKKLGSLGGPQSRAFAINSNGQIVGSSRTSSGKTHAFIYQAGAMKDLGALSGGLSEANDINDAGAVVGYSTILSGAERAVRWQNGVKKNLGSLGGLDSRATAINNGGVIVGWSDTKSGDTHAFVYQNGVMTDIGTLGGTTSHAWGINDVGKVVGSSTTASGKLHAFVWVNGTFQDLGDAGTQFGEAIAINNGRLVGNFGASPDAEGGDREVVVPFVMATATGVTTIFFTRRHTSHAHDINADGIIVGGDEDDRLDQGATDAWVRQTDGTVQNLPTLTDGLTAAQGINRSGVIVGYSEGADGWPKAVFWHQ
jgi:probable HAF family extracellular repeat protein